VDCEAVSVAKPVCAAALQRSSFASRRSYHKLTNVRWEIPAPANEVTGFVYTETDGDSTPMPFSISEKKAGTVAAADELWGMIARS
jgi:hypothetical protein